jgi:hypothetical protein
MSNEGEMRLSISVVSFSTPQGTTEKVITARHHRI